MDIVKIPFEKLQNTRDLGQFTTADGRSVISRRLLRSGHLNDLNLEDRAILLNDYKLQMIIDFRTAIEKNNEPDSKLSGVSYYWIPILDEQTMGISQDERTRGNGLGQLKDFLMQDAFDVSSHMINTYRSLIEKDYCRSQYRSFFKLLQEAPSDGAILWHCSAGKDRVGIASALLLSALGVDSDTVMEDYLATNKFTQQTVNHLITMLTELAGTKEIIPKIDAFFSVSPDYLKAAFDVVDTEFGGMESFLESQMGLGQQELLSLRNKFLQ